MNNILECIETGAFNELINFSFEEVRAFFNFNQYFVLDEDGDQFIKEATQVKNWYTDELNKIEEYTQNEYTNNINSGIDVPEFDEPQYKINQAELQTKRKLIGLIKKYLNKDLFELNKPQIYGHPIFKEQTVETPHELLIALNLNKNRLYSLLSIIGYYQRKHGYFLSQASFLSICNEYSNQVYRVNKSLGMQYRFVNIFIGSERIKPSKGKKENLTDEELENLKHYQNNKFIDVDKISLLMLIQPYLKYNTKELCKIIEIMEKTFKTCKDGDLAWDITMSQVGEFISNCETKGIMRRFG